MDDDASAGRLGFDELERQRRLPFREQPLATSQDDRVKPEPVFVDQVVLDQRLGEPAAAVDLEFPPILAFQLCDLFGKIALDQY